jgi:hypothetical protein
MLKPAPFFKKLDESSIDERYARLEGYQLADHRRVEERASALFTSMLFQRSD